MVAKPGLEDTHFSDEEVLLAVGKPDVIVCVQFARLRFLWRLLHFGSSASMRVLDSAAPRKKSFVSLVIDDLKVMQAYDNDLSHLPSPDDDLCAWLDHIHSFSSVGHWCACVSK
eukprot:4987743-Karenia_brevis.AAC.1